MELGEKLRQARLDANLSQRALCGEEITRNMLSRIENGVARPSMKTLQYLAARLGKPVSYFLEETAVVSPNQKIMDAARRLYDAGEFSQASEVLEKYQSPDEVYDREKDLLWVLIRLELAEAALNQGRTQYARKILEQTPVDIPYCSEELQRRKLLLLGEIPGSPRVAHQLPTLDEELLLRSEDALRQGNPQRSARLLDAAQDQSAPRWLLLRGETYLALNAYQDAAFCLHQAEETFPEAVTPKLERCYRELGDYKQAYFYACKQKGNR